MYIPSNKLWVPVPKMKAFLQVKFLLRMLKFDIFLYKFSTIFLFCILMFLLYTLFPSGTEPID